MRRRAFRRRDFRVETDDGVSIAVTYCDARSRRMVVLAPGFWRRRTDRENVFVAAHLARCGYDVATFDFRGHGDSGGSYGFGRDEWQDFLAVARWYRPTHRALAAVGFSMGGSIAAEAIARAPFLPFRALVMVSSPSDLARLRPKPWKPSAWKMMGIGRALSPPRIDWTSASREKPRAADAVGRIRIPKLIVTFEDDWLVDPSHGDELERCAAPPAERVHLGVAGSLHADAVVRFAPVAFLRVLTRFLKEHFPPAPV
jgi:pimeloyl-ACP methyl ester carboxylesterase